MTNTDQYPKEQRSEVTVGHHATYSDPLEIIQGQMLTVGDRDPEFPGWVWCEDQWGKCGWAPESYLNIIGNAGVATRDYSARELSVTPGEVLALGEVECGWVWATNSAGNSGWVPLTAVSST